jgi:hypothetical protein
VRLQTGPGCRRQVIVEVKAVSQVLPIHKAQVLTYLKLTGLTVGLLINFNVEMIRLGIYRISNSRGALWTLPFCSVTRSVRGD